MRHRFTARCTSSKAMEVHQRTVIDASNRRDGDSRHSAQGHGKQERRRVARTTESATRRERRSSVGSRMGGPVRTARCSLAAVPRRSCRQHGAGPAGTRAAGAALRHEQAAVVSAAGRAQGQVHARRRACARYAGAGRRSAAVRRVRTSPHPQRSASAMVLSQPYAAAPACRSWERSAGASPAVHAGTPCPEPHRQAASPGPGAP
jgi:hypothetical protein